MTSIISKRNRAHCANGSTEHPSKENQFIFIYLQTILQLEKSIGSDFAEFEEFQEQLKINLSKPKTDGSILKEFEDSDLPGANHVVEYMRHNYIKNWKRTTLENISGSLKSFLVFCKSIGRLSLDQVTRQDIETYVESEQDRGMKISTVRSRLNCIYAFMRFLIEIDSVHPDILKRKIHLKLPQHLPRHMSAKDIDLLLGVIKDTRNRAMILMLLRTGMRIGELLNTRVSDINIKEQKVLIYEGEKNSEGRVVYFNDDASKALNEWLKVRDAEKRHLFYGLGWREKLTYSGARKVFIKYCKKAGLSGKGYSLHCLRHTYATDLLNAGMHLECLQPLLGHSSIEVTRIYARLSDRTREEEYFKAMSIIEGRKSNVNQRFHSELQKIFKEEKSSKEYGDELFEPA